MINGRRRRLVIILQQLSRLLQLVQTFQTTTSVLLLAPRAGSSNTRLGRPWMLPRPNFGWFELNWELDSQCLYWKEHFRMKKETFVRLVNLVAPMMERRTTRLRQAISTPKRVAIALCAWREMVFSRQHNFWGINTKL